MELHPQIISHQGQPQFAVLDYQEFQALKQRLEDLEDLSALNEAIQTEQQAPTTPLVEVLQRFGLSA